jgi:hypothetical protein
MDTNLPLSPPAESASPTVTAAEGLATEVAEAIEAIAAHIPGLEAPHPSTAKRVRGARTVSREFLVSMIAAVEGSPDLQTAGTFDPEEARATLQFNDAFRSIADRLAALLASVNYTMESRKAKIARDAMTTYAIAKALARDPGGAALVPHLETLRRDLGRKTGRPATATPPPATPEPR